VASSAVVMAVAAKSILCCIFAVVDDRHCVSASRPVIAGSHKGHLIVDGAKSEGGLVYSLRTSSSYQNS
jgi:hypothetical protein